MPLSALALEIAASRLGIRETARNSNPENIDRWLAGVDCHPGDAWCAAYLHDCFEEAAARLGLRNPFPRTGSSLAVWRHAEPICRDSMPSVGAVYVLQHSPTTGHVGIVERVDSLGLAEISEISGNTNEQGSREGNAVARHAGTTPEVIHGGTLLGYLQFDRAAQDPRGPLA